jgi:steroid delta-isomerase-like uncharacterized protein
VSAAPEDAAFAARYAAAWNSADAATLAALLTEDIVWSDPALPQPARGIAAVQQFMLASVSAFPDLRFSDTDPPLLARDGDTITWGWTMTGAMRGPVDPPGFAPTGRRMSVDGVDVWHMRGPRIARYRAYYDMSDVARQLGLAPPRGGAAERAAVALQRLQARLRRR